MHEQEILLKHSKITWNSFYKVCIAVVKPDWVRRRIFYTSGGTSSGCPRQGMDRWAAEGLRDGSWSQGQSWCWSVEEIW